MIRLLPLVLALAACSSVPPPPADAGSPLDAPPSPTVTGDAACDRAHDAMEAAIAAARVRCGGSCTPCPVGSAWTECGPAGCRSQLFPYPWCHSGGAAALVLEADVDACVEAYVHLGTCSQYDPAACWSFWR